MNAPADKVLEAALDIVGARLHLTQIRRLLDPAAGDAVVEHHRLVFDWLLPAVRDAVRQQLGGAARLELESVDVPLPAFETTQSFELARPGALPMVLALDAAMVRLLCNSLDPSIALPLDSKHVSAAELGGSEAAVLKLLAQLPADTNGEPALVALNCHDRGLVPRDASAAPLARWVLLQVHARTRAGRAMIGLPVPQSPVEALSAPPEQPLATELIAQPVDLCVALAPIRLDELESAHLSHGDVLLLGTTDLARVTTQAQLTIGTDWLLGPMRIDLESPTVLRAQLTHWSVRRYEPTGPEAVVLIASRRINSRVLASINEGEVMDFDRPLLLVRLSNGITWAAELIRIHEELGVRLIQPTEKGTAL
jgi:hypothetical protein